MSPRSPSLCLTDAEVSAWAEGRASEEEKARYDRHVAGCEACATLAALLGALDGDLRPGTRVGRYEILARLGAGAMGVVYAAHDPELGRKVALKLIRANVAGPDLEVRLLREAKAMARLSHPNVIAVYDAGRNDDRLFIAMELVAGGTLREWLAERPCSWREILAAYVAAGRGLAQAHALGLVHRDFKPDNVLVSHDGRVQVTDFGLARNADSDEIRASMRSAERGLVAFDRTSPAPLTRTGALVGTPAYMAPEQLAGDRADARSDVYAFSVSLYEGLYGDRPFGGATIGEHLAEKEAGVLRMPPSARRVPARVRRALVTGLRPKPSQRHARMRDLLAPLEEAARWPLSKVSVKRAWLGLGAAAVVTAATGGWLGLRGHAPSAAPGVDPAKVAAAALAGGEERLACPIFEVRGADDVAVRLGAAAGALACARLTWELGGSDDRVLPLRLCSTCLGSRATSRSTRTCHPISERARLRSRGRVARPTSTARLRSSTARGRSRSWCGPPTRARSRARTTAAPSSWAPCAARSKRCGRPPWFGGTSIRTSRDGPGSRARRWGLCLPTSRCSTRPPAAPPSPRTPGRSEMVCATWRRSASFEAPRSLSTRACRRSTSPRRRRW